MLRERGQALLAGGVNCSEGLVHRNARQRGRGEVTGPGYPNPHFILGCDCRVNPVISEHCHQPSDFSLRLKALRLF